ncbi:MAG: radical SAM family heme chaperone HemW [Candidatus Rokubacteria bacterium]|nr:radical SAM family heme chaperone HemW [Candidatus Rokubacteria bacterium]
MVPAGGALGLYVHVPFCEQRCPYCAFNTAPMEDAAMARFVRALLREIDLLAAPAQYPGEVSHYPGEASEGPPLRSEKSSPLRLPKSADITLATIFFGGGTPSLLEPDDMAAILERVRRRFSVASDAEITVEANPESVTREKLAAYRAAGVNRVSLGVQALADDVLGRLGRGHAAHVARAAFVAAREAGVANLSVDLMYGVPGLDLAAWQRGVAGVLDWEPDHLSAYGLSLDAGSLWGAGGPKELPAEETTIAQYWHLAGAAAERDFEHYEISNYARPGFRSAHNQIYWRRGEYLAAGPGACGFVGDVRWSNIRAVPRWADAVARDRLPVDTQERLTSQQALAERLLLGLRTADGVPSEWLDARTAGDPALTRRLDAWRDEGLLVETAGRRARLSERGFLLSDALFVELT